MALDIIPGAPDSEKGFASLKVDLDEEKTA
jgi:hypothetical protein